jgi:hypothetical protein
MGLLRSGPEFTCVSADHSTHKASDRRGEVSYPMVLGRMGVPTRTTYQHERGSAAVWNGLEEIKVAGLVGL